MFGMAPQGAMPMQGWPPHMMPGGFPLDVNVTLPDAPDANQVLKLKGLPFSASARDVGVFFEDFSVVSCSIHHGSDGRPSGMAYVVFHTADEAQRALAKDKAYIGERFVRILRVAHPEMDDQLGGRQIPGYGSYAGYPSAEALAAMHAAWMHGLYPPPGMYPQMGSGFPGFQPRVPTQPQPQAAPPLRPAPCTTVKMRGLPFRVSPDEVISFFAGFEIEEDSLRLGSNAHGRPSGEGWLTFGSEEEAARAARERNRQYLGSRYLELTLV